MDKLVHGGDIYSHSRKMIDFSANINPLGMPEVVKQAIKDNVDNYMCYPDPLNRSLTKAIAKHDGVNENSIVCGNGAADVIFRTVLTLKPKKALIVSPTFAEYEQALSVVNCEIEHFFISEQDGFVLQKDILKAIDTRHDIMFLCNPNNPTGIPVEREFILEIANRCKECGVIFVVDECFTEFLEQEESYSIMQDVAKLDNVIILKAFTKIYAMAGIRLGYAVCGSGDFAKRISQMLQPWSVSTVASVCGVSAISQVDFVKRTKAYVKENRQWLKLQLEQLGFTVYQSQANYILFKTDRNIVSELLEKGILIRSCNNYPSLDERYYRIAVKSCDDNEYLVKCLKEIVG